MIEVEAIFPVMVTPELEAVKQFYETVFGFNTAFYDPDFYLHLVSQGTDAQLGFLLPQHATQPAFLHPVMATEGYVISLEVKDAAQAYEESIKMDLSMAMPLKEEAWGQVHFILRDPAGLYVDIVQHQEVAGD